ncbi:uncharacterized protein M421DRAFT_194900 [Didymella exigua CBS 183.55]|uniref:Uncharacterized protein n=1 Tax=Didymella exigua CBS 183.55 TaxID=1150837 RepID=A0A6A5RXX1_9PLEO|nr:uncharacterized protein M421DRAFT_194900 [Didymella exigua CBS 183.55]KAF1933345.1 hypothetical protein M421DRAFT_194900 [Didymella exigua CBS 183.55]
MSRASRLLSLGLVYLLSKPGLDFGIHLRSPPLHHMRRRSFDVADGLQKECLSVRQLLVTGLQVSGQAGLLLHHAGCLPPRAHFHLQSMSASYGIPPLLGRRNAPLCEQLVAIPRDTEVLLLSLERVEFS